MRNELRDFEKNLARMELLVRFAVEYSKEHKEDLVKQIDEMLIADENTLDIRNYKGLVKELLDSILSTGVVFLKAAIESSYLPNSL